MDHEFIEVRSSGIHGSGVFAKKDIKNGTKIIEYVGEKITKEEADKRGDRDLENGTVYIFELDEEYDIDGAVNGNDARFINHSCSPNCEVEVEDDHIWIVAIKDIKQGEELGYDYGFDVEDFEEYPCKCSSPDCRGYIIGEEHAHKVTQKSMGTARMDGKTKSL